MKRLLLPVVALALLACDDASVDPHAGLDVSELADADPMARISVPENASALERMHIVGHGRIFDKSGREVAMTPDYLARLQDEIYARLSRANRLQGRDRSTVLAARRSAVALPAKARADLMTGVNAKLLSAAPSSTRRDLDWRVAFLARNLQASSGGQENFLAFPRQFDRLFDFSDLLKPFQISRTNDYVDRCREAGVPIPPAWSMAKPNGWTYHGELTTKLISSGDDAHVWTWSEGERSGFPFFLSRPVVADRLTVGTTLRPINDRLTPIVPKHNRGACILLPRGTGDSNDVAGIWCQSATTGNACVWDNIGRVSGQMIPWSSGTLNVVNMQDGDTLAPGSNCNACHKGNNAFLISPDDPTWAKVIRPGWLAKWRRPNLTTNLDASAGTRFTMISNQPGWNNAAGSACIGCHERPTVSFASVPNPMPPNCSTTGNTTAGCYTMP